MIHDSNLDSSIKRETPWDQAATTHRPLRGKVAPDRKLDDPAFNRPWE